MQEDAAGALAEGLELARIRREPGGRGILDLVHIGGQIFTRPGRQIGPGRADDVGHLLQQGRQVVRPVGDQIGEAQPAEHQGENHDRRHQGGGDPAADPPADAEPVMPRGNDLDQFEDQQAGQQPRQQVQVQHGHQGESHDDPGGDVTAELQALIRVPDHLRPGLGFGSDLRAMLHLVSEMAAFRREFKSS